MLQNKIEGGKIGQRFEHFVKSAMEQGDTNEDFVANDFFRKKGKLIRTSSAMIRDEGSIEQVAERLGVNKVTVYSYLDEVRGKR